MKDVAATESPDIDFTVTETEPSTTKIMPLVLTSWIPSRNRYTGEMFMGVNGENFSGQQQQGMGDDNDGNMGGRGHSMYSPQNGVWQNQDGSGQVVTSPSKRSDSAD